MGVMKTLFASVSILVLFIVNASAIGGEIDYPQIGHHVGIDKFQKEKVHALLEYMENELKFIEGSFINEFSTQRFGGASEKAGRFIGMLKEVGIWEVEIGFRDFGEQESAFILHQNSAKTLSLSINSGRSDFLLKDFSHFLPQPAFGLATRRAIQNKAEQDGAEDRTNASRDEAGGR